MRINMSGKVFPKIISDITLLNNPCSSCLKSYQKCFDIYHLPLFLRCCVMLSEHRNTRFLERYTPGRTTHATWENR